MSPKPAPCPICGQPAVPDARPFCSTGCKDRDLLQWLGEGYRVPGPPADDLAGKNDHYGLDSGRD